jgi:uncharacterized membrane protein YkvA (DUF1232 family)
MARNVGLAKYLRRASSIVKDPKKLKRIAAAVVRYAKTNKGPVNAFLKDLRLLWEIARDTANGRYENTPTRSMILIAAALIYFLSPVDLIPDLLPGGFIDDAAVIAWVVQSSRGDIQKYKRWKNRRKRT